jgi:hypothetical protein
VIASIPEPQEAPTAPPATAAAICRRAAELVGGDRQRTHGDKVANHANIAALWTAFLRRKLRDGATITALDVALMMVLLKVARTLTGNPNPDDYIDAAGYAGVAGEIAARPGAER